MIEGPLAYSSSERFLRKLIGGSEIEDALQRLDNLTQEEHRMATAQDLGATHHVNERVKGVDDKMDVVIDGLHLLFVSLYRRLHPDRFCH